MSPRPAAAPRSPRGIAGVRSESDYTIDATDFARAAAALNARGFAVITAPIVAIAVRDTAVIVRRRVRQAASRHRKTGALQSGVIQEFAGAGFDFIGRVRSTGPVAHLIAGGTRPHEIVGIRHALPLRGFGGQAVRFASRVHHPGTRADPYFHRGVQQAVPEINHLLRDAAHEMTDALRDAIARPGAALEG